MEYDGSIRILIMLMPSAKQHTVSVPQTLLSSMVDAHRSWERFSEEFEDFLSASDQQFIKKMRRARKEHVRGSVRGISHLKAELG